MRNTKYLLVVLLLCSTACSSLHLRKRGDEVIVYVGKEDVSTVTNPEPVPPQEIQLAAQDTGPISATDVWRCAVCVPLYYQPGLVGILYSTTRIVPCCKR